MWLRTVYKDRQPFNLGLASAKRIVQNHSSWHMLLEKAMSMKRPRWWC